MAKVNFMRKLTDEEVQNIEVVDGQFLVSGEGTAYVDYNGKRVPLGDKASISQLRTALGLDNDTYVEEEVYSKGELVVYNHTLYECSQDNVTGEFDNTKWLALTIMKLIEKVGKLSDLNTNDKSSIVNAINEINAILSYSTDEQIVGKWIDGSNVYRKVVTGTTSTQTGVTAVLLSNVKHLISINGYYLQSGRVSETSALSDNTSCVLDESTNVVTYYFNNASISANFTYNFILEYIKND